MLRLAATRLLGALLLLAGMTGGAMSAYELTEMADIADADTRSRLDVMLSPQTGYQIESGVVVRVREPGEIVGDVALLSETSRLVWERFVLLSFVLQADYHELKGERRRFEDIERIDMRTADLRLQDVELVGRITDLAKRTRFLIDLGQRVLIATTIMAALLGIAGVLALIGKPGRIGGLLAMVAATPLCYLLVFEPLQAGVFVVGLMTLIVAPTLGLMDWLSDRMASKGVLLAGLISLFVFGGIVTVSFFLADMTVGLSTFTTAAAGVVFSLVLLGNGALGRVRR